MYNGDLSTENSNDRSKCGTLILQALHKWFGTFSPKELSRVLSIAQWGMQQDHDKENDIQFCQKYGYAKRLWTIG